MAMFIFTSCVEVNPFSCESVEERLPYNFRQNCNISVFACMGEENEIENNKK